MSVKVVKFDSVTYTISITNDQYVDLQDIVYQTGVKHSVIIEGILLERLNSIRKNLERSQANGKAESRENREATETGKD